MLWIAFYGLVTVCTDLSFSHRAAKGAGQQKRKRIEEVILITSFLVVTILVLCTVCILESNFGQISLLQVDRMLLVVLQSHFPSDAPFLFGLFTKAKRRIFSVAGFEP